MQVHYSLHIPHETEVLHYIAIYWGRPGGNTKYLIKIGQNPPKICSKLQKYPKFFETVYIEYTQLVNFNVNIPYTRFKPPLDTVYPKLWPTS